MDATEEIPTDQILDLLGITNAQLLEAQGRGFVKQTKRHSGKWPLGDTVRGYARFCESRIALATRNELAEEFSMSGANVDKYVADGVLPPPAQKISYQKMRLWDRIACRQAFTKHQAERRATLGSAETRVRDARARDLELRTAIRARDYILTSEALLALDTVVGVTRAQFDGAAAQISRDVNVQRKAEQVIDGCLSRVAEGLRKAGDALRAGGDPNAAAAEAIAG